MSCIIFLIKRQYKTCFEENNQLNNIIITNHFCSPFHLSQNVSRSDSRQNNTLAFVEINSSNFFYHKVPPIE